MGRQPPPNPIPALRNFRQWSLVYAVKNGYRGVFFAAIGQAVIKPVGIEGVGHSVPFPKEFRVPHQRCPRLALRYHFRQTCRGTDGNGGLSRHYVPIGKMNGQGSDTHDIVPELSHACCVFRSKIAASDNRNRTIQPLCQRQALSIEYVLDPDPHR